ncbi:transcriptional regulator [Candidatus Nitrosotalea bavarica]|uniref:transcriptional regulator n=1 Tax=Candidatus Nitrosotalea bavarica TaxID=1903277 RepID=UPI0015B1FD19|nr:transcriptional regulator [Candidatus Nitrosotalea bavarica]
MSGFDSLIGKSLVLIIKKNLTQSTLEKIENRVFEKFGTNLTQVSNDFPKLDLILREFFGDGANVMERKLLQHIISVQQSKIEKKEWITIEDLHINRIILEAIGDNDKKNILNAVLDKPRIISDILEICKIPQTSGYRKVNNLIQNGLLIINGHESTEDGKTINKYQPVFDNIQIHVEKNKVIVQVQLRKEYLDNSSIFTIHFQNLMTHVP